MVLLADQSLYVFGLFVFHFCFPTVELDELQLQQLFLEVVPEQEVS